jgi:hypothetical protein
MISRVFRKAGNITLMRNPAGLAEFCARPAAFRAFVEISF